MIFDCPLTWVISFLRQDLTFFLAGSETLSFTDFSFVWVSAFASSIDFSPCTDVSVSSMEDEFSLPSITLIFFFDRFLTALAFKQLPFERLEGLTMTSSVVDLGYCWWIKSLAMFPAWTIVLLRKIIQDSLELDWWHRWIYLNMYISRASIFYVIGHNSNLKSIEK